MQDPGRFSYGQFTLYGDVGFLFGGNCWIGCNWKSTLFIHAQNSPKKKQQQQKKPFNLPLKTIQKFYPIINYGYVKFPALNGLVRMVKMQYGANNSKILKNCIKRTGKFIIACENASMRFVPCCG